MTFAASVASIASRQAARRGVPWLGALFIAAIVALATFDIVRSYRATVEQTGRELETQARILAEQTARSMQAVDVALRHVTAEFRRGRLASLSPEELHGYLRDQAVGLVQIEGFVMHDANGDALAISWLPPRTAVNIAQTAGFRRLRDDPSLDFSIGAAAPSPTDGEWMIPIGRRLETPAGDFAGLVGARGRIEYFQDFYRDVQLDRGTSVTLVHGNGALLARYPATEAALGKRFALFDEMLASLAWNRPGPLRIESPLDGVERFATVRLVPDYTLAVIVTRDTEVALAPWRAQARATAVQTLALGLLASLLLTMLMRQLSRLLATRESLEATRERFALAVAGSDDGIWDWDRKTDLIFASARARELYGLEPAAEMQTREAWLASQHFHPDDGPRRIEAIEAHIAGRTPLYEGEYRVCHRDGSYRWVRIRGLCVRDAAGVAQRMAGSVSDIDARKRAEESLRLSEERYALAMAGLRGGHWVWEVQSDALFVSGTLNELFGLPADTQPATRHEYFAQITLHPDDRARMQQVGDELVGGGVPRADFEYRILLRGSDELRWITTRAQAFTDADGVVVRVAGVSVDITDRKRTEEALRTSEERFALAVAGSADGVWDWDFNAGLAFESARARELQGLPPGPELQPLPDLLESLRVHPEDAPRRAEGIRAHLTGETPAYECEYRVRHDDGNYRWVRIRALCTRDANGRPVRMAGSVSDIDARKRAEQALRLSEERYSIAMTGSEEAHWVWNIRTDELYASPQLCRLAGVAIDAQPSTRTAWMATIPIHCDDRARLEQAVADHLAGLTPRVEVEYRLADGDGREPRWLHMRGQCFRDADGRPERMAGSTVEVTARKRAEEALRGSEERFALAVAGSNDGILDWDIVHDRMFASERLMRMVGLEPDDALRTRAEWSALVMPRFHPDDARRVLAELRGEPGNPADAHEGEYRARDAEGVYRWRRFRGRTVRNGSGRAIRWAGSVSDIDAQKKTEEALRESEQRYQLAVAGSNEGMWDWDMRSETFFFSARAQQLVGLDPGAPMRPCKEWWALLFGYHPDDEKRVSDALSAYLGGAGEHWEVEYRLRHHRSGDWHWFRERGVALRDEQGRPYRMAGSIEDISARKKAEADRDRLEQQLRQSQKLEAMGTLAGGIAHDFNNILAAILGYGEMAQKDAAEGSAQRRHIDAALSAGMRAKSLVERILAFSRSGMGERVAVHVESVVAEALDAVSASLPAGVRLESTLAAGDAAVLGDATQIHQVVMNLCANAVQSMKSTGTLAVAVEAAQFGEACCIHTAQLPAGSYVRLSVRDSGSGIAPQLLERIFDPFFTTKQVGVGTGLGLSLVHGIAADLGGGIDVASEVGCGSTFTVYLPWQGSVAAPRAAEEPPAGGGDGETIMLVDDEEALVRLGEEMMAELGYEPVGFASSTAALETFRATPERFDIVLSDEAMPELTGSELAREIRRIRPDIPIVLMTGYVTPALSARARDIGIDEVLAKPLVAREIARSLAGALRR